MTKALVEEKRVELLERIESLVEKRDHARFELFDESLVESLTLELDELYWLLKILPPAKTRRRKSF